MTITIELTSRERVALERVAKETGEELDAAAGIAIREFLISLGMLGPTYDLAEDTVTAGEA